VVVAPTVREEDGLALSSRNKYLSEAQRTQAVILWRAIRQAKISIKTGAVSAARLKEELGALIQTQPEARVDYMEFFDPVGLVPVLEVTKGTHLALAVFVGKTRLIDNAAL
jgi:pantothenate synthetase